MKVARACMNLTMNAVLPTVELYSFVPKLRYNSLQHANRSYLVSSRVLYTKRVHPGGHYFKDFTLTKM